MNSPKDEHLSIKEILNLVKDYFLEIRKSWLLILLALLLLVPAYLLKINFQKPSYKAEITFMVNEDQAGGFGGGLGSLLGGFGIGRIGQNANLEKILSLAKSDRILSNALCVKDTINSRNDLLANHLINYADSTGKWYKRKWFEKLYKEPSKMKEYRLPFDFDMSRYTRKNQTVINALNKIFRGMIHAEYGEQDLIIIMSTSTEQEELSESMVKNLFLTLKEYYINQSTEKHYLTYQLFKSKNDSLNQALKIAEYQLARYYDTENSLFAKTDQLKESALRREIQKLTAIIIEVTKNMEIADFALKNSTPFIQVLDQPMLPLPSQKTPLFTAFVRSFLFACFISIGFIVVRKFWQKLST